MRHKGDLPAFSDHVIEINKKLSSLKTINFSSAGELSNVILKDMSLTNKLLKVVNSSYYGNISGKVTTISRAVFLLGAEKIRLAAASVMPFISLLKRCTALENFTYKITRSSDYFNIAVIRPRDVMVDDSLLPGVKENLPGWYVKMVSARSFLIYPLMIKEKCIGPLYADKKNTKILNNDDERDYMNILRTRAIWAITHKH